MAPPFPPPAGEVSLPTESVTTARPPRAAGVRSGWLSRQLGFVRDRRRLLAIVILGLAGGVILALLIPRGELAGSDARAYWAGIRIWLDGGDPFDPPAPFLPYVYFPWSLVPFVPWSLLPWDIAWFVWRGANILLFLWSADWAYRRRPLATALVVAFMALPLAATLDTGNVTLFVVMAVWAAQFTGPRLGGFLWAMASALKWFPALLLPVLLPRARLWGIGWLALFLFLAVATLEQTITQVDVAINFPRPLRLDYILLLYAALPWIWRQPWPLPWLNRAELRRLLLPGRGALGTRLREFFGMV